MAEAFEFGIDEATALEGLLQRLQTRWRVEPMTARGIQMIYLDSFDWRLYRAGYSLRIEVQGERRIACLRPLVDSRDMLQTPLPATPRFGADLPHGPLRKRIESALEMRALMPVAVLRGNRETIELLDAETKVRARLLIDRFESLPGAGVAQSMLHTIAIDSVKGYERDHKALRGMLASDDGLRRLPETLLRRALRALGREQGDYDSRLRFEFAPDTVADVALRKVLLHLAAALRTNEAGIKQDIDTEFLHDFRVAIRRTRSVLSQFKAVFPDEPLAHYRAEFSWLGNCTGLLRDLDVYLLSLDDYKRRLSPHLHEGINRLQPFLRQRRSQARDRLVAELGSPRYRQLLAGWQKFLRSRDWPRPGPAPITLNAVVALRIRALRRRVLRDGRAIDRHTPPAGLHRLRGECKKLRYLLEMFSSLFGETAPGYIKALKRLQELLGDYQDCDVQTRKLLGLAGDIHRQDPQNVATLMSMGGLVEELDRRMSSLRRRFHARFDEFVAADAEIGFGQLLDAMLATEPPPPP